MEPYPIRICLWKLETMVNSTLSDFVLGDFDLCDIEVVKTGDPLSKIGDDVSYSVTINNTGVTDLYLQSVVDSQVDNLLTYRM